MNYTKGKWFSHDNGTYIELRSDCPDGELLSWTAIGDVCTSKFSAVGDLGAENASRIVDCVNACDGMENPVDEIAKLRYEIAMLYRLIDDKDSEIARMAIIAAKAENNLADALDEIDELRASSAGWK